LFSATFAILFSYIMKTKYIQWKNDDVRFVLDQHP
jgi:hypothetical protein